MPKLTKQQQAYLDEKIEDGTKTWSGKDANAFIDMVRWRDALIPDNE